MSVFPDIVALQRIEDKRVWMCEYERSIGMAIVSTGEVMVSTPVVVSPTTTMITNDKR